MELYSEMLTKVLTGTLMEIKFPDLDEELPDLLRSAERIALSRIKEIVEDDSIDDRECFERIEMIVEVLEQAGVSCANRHDFG